MAKKTNINELARRYTTAAFELAVADKALDKVSADLENLKSGLLGDEKTARFLNSPLLTAEKQVEFIKGAVKELKLNSITQNFLLVVARNRRLGNLAKIIEAFQEKIAEEKGEVSAKIISATELDNAQVKKISDDLGKKTGKQVIVKVEVDPSIIGGLIVKIGSAMYDYSVKTKLNRLAEQLKKAS
jgi:F-type H+-transporting ATPase subunit delta